MEFLCAPVRKAGPIPCCRIVHDFSTLSSRPWARSFCRRISRAPSQHVAGR
ncbi:uncharacterized protein TrAtP1_001005 [Trichoderma atroviride]|uniref:uncharacterized protein n=1 Tax=Hypocrea atroviridis TaxID=63577 RepID=UPI003322AB09|nr:hypothetical protein TrAtP1_001005 [Trichoderma atroviride]